MFAENFLFFRSEKNYISPLSRTLTLLIKPPHFLFAEDWSPILSRTQEKYYQRTERYFITSFSLIAFVCLECGWKFIWCLYLCPNENSANASESKKTLDMRNISPPFSSSFFHPHYSPTAGLMFCEMYFDNKWKWNSSCPKVCSSSCWCNVNPISKWKELKNQINFGSTDIELEVEKAASRDRSLFDEELTDFANIRRGTMDYFVRLK